MSGPGREPPRFWVRVRDRVLPREESARLARELDELYAVRLERDGPAAARAWYRGQVLAFAVAALTRAARAPFAGAAGAVRDVRFAARALARAPVVTVVALVTLAAGIGASTLVFTLVDGVLLRPLPYPEPDRLVSVWSYVTRGELDVIRSEARSLEQAKAYVDLDVGVNLEHDAGAERLATSYVEPGLFDMLGARPLLGRLFAPGESRPGRDGVVLLGEGLWRARFGADPGIVGRSVTLDGRAHEVVGVLPAEWTFPGADDQLWLPLPWDPTRAGPFWGSGGLRAVGRLAPGVGVSAAQRELRGLSAEIAARNPLWSPPPDYRAQAPVVPLRETLTNDVRRTLFLLLSAVVVMLAAVCANVAGLLLTRALERQPLVALRAALGAGRGRLARESLVEGGLLGLGGAALGAVLAHVGLTALRSTLLAEIPRASELHVDARVLTVAAAVGVLAGLVASTAPTVRALRGDPGAVLREGGRGGSRGRRRAVLTRTLVTGQISAAVVLVASTGLLVRSLAELGRVDPGFRTEGILTAEVTFPSNADAADTPAALAAILDRVAALPGVRGAALAGSIPFGRRDEAYATFVDEAGLDPSALPMIDADRVSPAYFETLGIPILQGRAFDGRDRVGAPLVAVVDELMAEEYWPDRSPLGGRVRFPWAGAPWLEVVGVVGSVADDRLAEPRAPRWYLPLLQQPLSDVALVIEVDGSPAAIAPGVRRAVAEVDERLPLSRVAPYETLLGDAEARTRLATRLLAGFALTALLLGCLGVYGVAAQAVRERTREIGVRVALGADGAAIGGDVLREGMLLAAPGALLGLVGTAAATRLLEGMLVGVRALDPVVFFGVPVLMAAAALLALWIPARRAARVDPAQVLRRG